MLKNHLFIDVGRQKGFSPLGPWPGMAAKNKENLSTVEMFVSTFLISKMTGLTVEEKDTLISNIVFLVFLPT